MNKIVCPNCGKSDCFITINEELVCCNCGFVIDRDIITMELPPIYKNEDYQLKINTSHPQNPVLNIYRPHSIKFKEHAKDKKIISSYTSEDRFYFRVNSLLSDFSLKLNLSDDIKNLALLVVMRYVNKKGARPKNLRGVVAASIYVALRLRGNLRPLDVISRRVSVKKKTIIKYFKEIRELLRLKLEPPRPERYIRNFGKELRLSNECITLAMKLLQKLRSKKVSLGHEPKGIAAAVLYLAAELSGETRGKKEVADIASVTELTIRKKYNQIKSILMSDSG